MIKSCLLLYARTPANDEIVSPKGMFFSIDDAFFVISSNPLRRTDVSNSPSAEVGPISTFPSVVGVTRTPLPAAVGTANTVCRTNGGAILSNNMYSPFLAPMRKESSPNIAATFAAFSPAQLTTHRASTRL